MDNLQLSQSGSFVFASAGLATSTSGTSVKTTNAVTYTVDGQWYSFAATDNIPFSTQYTSQTYNPTPPSIPANSTCLVGVFIDSNSVVTFVQGKAVSTIDLVNGVAPLQFPANTDAGSPVAGKPRGRACLGFVRIQNAQPGNATFVFGTTPLAATGVTVSFINTASAPGEPLRS